MSIRIMAHVWAASLASTRKLVALALADNARDDTDLCWPSLQHLIHKTGLDRKTIIAAIASLEADGILEDSGEREGKTRQIKVYRITVPKLVSLRTAYSQAREKGPKSPRKQTRFSAKQSQKRDTEPLRTIKEPTAAAQVVPNTTSEAPVIHRQGAAAPDLIWPHNLPHGQRAAIEHYLKANPSSNSQQQLLDELEGVMRENAVRDPVAFFLHIAKQQAAGKFLPSHAHRVQVEREGADIERELREQP